MFSAIAEHEAPESNRAQNVVLNSKISSSGRFIDLFDFGIGFVTMYWELLQLKFDFRGSLPITASTDEPLRRFPTYSNFVSEPIVAQVVVIGPRRSDTPL